MQSQPIGEERGRIAHEVAEDLRWLTTSTPGIENPIRSLHEVRNLEISLPGIAWKSCWDADVSSAWG